MAIVNDDGVFESELEAAQVDWSKLNQPLGEIKGTGKEDSPVVATTASPLITIREGDVGEAINVGMGAGPAMIAGSASKTASIPARMKAAIELNKGADSKEVLQQTGWFKGTDGRMKYEISDEGMKLADRDWKFGETGKLSDFVEHPELFKAYPELKDINFKVADKDYKYIGSYNDASKTLTINPNAVRAGDEGILDVLTHEIQHIIQSKEGFATGSNPVKALNEALDALKDSITGKPYDTEKEKLIALYMDMKAKAKDFGEYMYLRSPGEVEANMSAARRKLSDEMRKKFPIEEHKKLVEGEVNTLHGGKYLPEFNYPK